MPWALERHPRTHDLPFVAFSCWGRRPSETRVVWVSFPAPRRWAGLRGASGASGHAVPARMRAPALRHRLTAMDVSIWIGLSSRLWARAITRPVKWRRVPDIRVKSWAEQQPRILRSPPPH